MLKFLSAALLLFWPFGHIKSDSALAARASLGMVDLSLDHRLRPRIAWDSGYFSDLNSLKPPERISLRDSKAAALGRTFCEP
jgi:hypothetical protein